MTRGTRKKIVKLWLDDIRPAPEGWVWVKTADRAIAALTTLRTLRLVGDLDKLTHMSFDHDLGDTSVPEKTGYTVALWMAEHEFWPTDECIVHSANVSGAPRIRGVIDRYGPYAKPCRWRPVGLHNEPLDMVPNWIK